MVPLGFIIGAVLLSLTLPRPTAASRGYLQQVNNLLSQKRAELVRVQRGERGVGGYARYGFSCPKELITGKPIVDQFFDAKARIKVLKREIKGLERLRARLGGGKNAVFLNPTLDGYRLDWCRSWGRDCGKLAADAFCRRKGFQEAAEWEEDYDIGARTPTRIISSGKICSDRGCDGFKMIRCRGAAGPDSGHGGSGPVLGRRRFLNPSIGGYRLDWCRRWGQECGKPAADAFCRSRGFKEAVAFQEAFDIGARTPTKIISSGKICSDSFCDGFEFIECAGRQADGATTGEATARILGPGRWDLVGPYELLSGNGRRDWRIALSLWGVHGMVVAMRVENVGGMRAVWDTVPRNGHWLLGVMRGDRLLNLPDGSVNISLDGPSEDLTLLVEDNGSLSGARTGFRVVVEMADGRILTAMVRPHFERMKGRRPGAFPGLKFE